MKKILHIHIPLTNTLNSRDYLNSTFFYLLKTLYIHRQISNHQHNFSVHVFIYLIRPNNVFVKLLIINRKKRKKKSNSTIIKEQKVLFLAKSL